MYQQTQPLGNPSRANGGIGKRLLSMFLTNKATGSGATNNQMASLRAGAGPLNDQSSLDWLRQRDAMSRALGYNSQTISGAFQNAYNSPYKF